MLAGEAGIIVGGFLTMTLPMVEVVAEMNFAAGCRTYLQAQARYIACGTVKLLHASAFRWCVKLGSES